MCICEEIGGQTSQKNTLIIHTQSTFDMQFIDTQTFKKDVVVD